MRLHLSLLLTLLLAGDGLAQSRAPKIWDDEALADWATPIAALGVRPGHFTSAEYYQAPLHNLKTYPVYHPDKEPPGYWEWLNKQKPQPLVAPALLHTERDWVQAGQEAFQSLDTPRFRRTDLEAIRAARDSRSYDGVWTQPDGTLLKMRWVVTESGIQLGFTACGICHAMPRADGSVLWAAPDSKVPGNAREYNPKLPPRPTVEQAGVVRDSPALGFWRQFTVPWDPDERIERYRDPAQSRVPLVPSSPIRGVFARANGSPYAMTKIPDLNNLKYSRYIDATGTHRLRGPADIARYGALVDEADLMEFGPHKLLDGERRRVPFRYADEVLFAIGVYLLSLEPPKNPDLAPAALVEQGRKVFARETCIQCHVPPSYTSGKLTLAQGYTPPADHPNRADIVKVSVGTDPSLALKTRKGTGFYKIPSLRGVWYRPLFLHDGSVASLEEMFDPDRLKPDHVPGGWKGPGVTQRAIPGHSFGLGLQPEEKSALLAFLRSL